MIVIPMAGLSSRFKKAGFDLPKYMLNAKGRSLFSHSVKSFEKYFSTEKFLFVALNVHNTADFIKKECEELGLINYEIVILDKPTGGQAETVYLGIKEISCAEESLTIFNIDTFRPGFSFPTEFNISEIDGYLETFIGSGTNWSNVLPETKGSQRVKQTAEKQEISEFCCTGLYYFNSSSDFIRIFEKEISKDINQLQGGEFYIAPMYNTLIEEGADIRFSVIPRDEVIFCGVPEEYYSFLDSDTKEHQ
jgi:NDP-sugar pyrophosphorylase family protein